VIQVSGAFLRLVWANFQRRGGGQVWGCGWSGAWAYFAIDHMLSPCDTGKPLVVGDQAGPSMVEGGQAAQSTLQWTTCWNHAIQEPGPCGLGGEGLCLGLAGQVPGHTLPLTTC
jgi:hypothetical protein